MITREQIFTQVHNRVYHQVIGRVWGQVSSDVHDLMNRATQVNIRDSVENRVWVQVERQVAVPIKRSLT